MKYHGRSTDLGTLKPRQRLSSDKTTRRRQLGSTNIIQRFPFITRQASNSRKKMVRNADPGQVERSAVYNHGSELNTRMSLVEVVHGRMNSSPDSPLATLIIADIQFESRNASRRFRNATIELCFNNIGPKDTSPPEVYAIAPSGVHSIDPTTRTQELKREVKADAGAGFVVNVSAGLEWSLTETQTKHSTAKLVGRITSNGRAMGPENVAMWRMDENEELRNGIPSLLRTAILLKRKEDKPFQCDVLLDAKVNWRKGIHLESRTVGSRIDPFLFDPTPGERTTPVPNYIDPVNLGSVLLIELAAIQSTTGQLGYCKFNS
jgi:hypothetical protein